MITIALMLADEKNRSMFLEIAKELEGPIKDFATKLSKDMRETTNSLAETTKAGLGLYADEIDSFIDKVVELSNALGTKAISSLNKFGSSASSIAGEALHKLTGKLKDFGDGLKSINKSVPASALKLLRTEMNGLAQKAKENVTDFFSLSNVYNKVADSIAYASKIGDLASLLDVNTESFSNWADVVTDSGGNIDTFASSLGNVKKYLNENCISADAFDYLLTMSEQMEGMNSEDAKALGDLVGIDQNTVMLLKQGSTNLQAMLEEQKKLGGVTKEDQATIEAFNKMMNTLNHIIRTVALQIGTTVLPALTWFFKKIQVLIDYLSEHKEFVKGFFIGISTVLLTILLPALWSAFAPILPVIGLLVLLGTVCGLVFSFFSEKMNETGGVFEWLRNTVSVAIEGIVNIFSWLVDAIGSSISTIIGFFTYWLDIVFTIIDTIFILFTQGPIEAIKFFQNAILDGLNKLYDMLPNWVKKLFSGIKGFFSSDESTTDIQAIEQANSVNEALAKGSGSLNGAQQTSQLLASANKPSISKNNQVSYRNNFTINGNNPEEVARLVDEKMRSMHQDAGEYYNDGVLV